MIREELTALPAAKSSHEEQAESPELDPESVAKNAEAFQRASVIVRDALSAHVWGEQQAEEFRTLRQMLTGEQFESLAKQLLPAINR